MIRKAIFTALASGALALGAGVAFAQSVTYAPPPSENLLLLQERVRGLETALREQTNENERLSVELRRTKTENARLERMLADALGQTQAPPADAATPVAPTGTGQLGTLPSNAAPLDAASQLREAMRYLQLGRFAEAEASFAAFAAGNPSSPDTPEARYFVGRTQVAQRRFPEAADTFVKFLGDYPNGARAPDAWVMLGVSLRGMDKTAEACGVFKDLPLKYPRASAAARNLASSEARAAGCR
jgi:tol-pal system protein YbgF